MVNEDRRVWGWLDYFLFLVRTIWIMNIGFLIFDAGSDDLEKWILLFWAGCLYILPHLFYRPGCIQFPKYVAIEAILTGSFFIYISSQYALSDTYSFFLPLLMVAYACQTKRLLWLGPVLYLAILLAGALAGGYFADHGIAGLFADTAIFYGIGLCLGRITIVNTANKELIASIEEKNKDLAYYAERVEELAIQEERNRVSQDLHDTVGHVFTAVVTSLDALPFLYRVDPIEAEKSIKELSDLARNSLNEVRQTIHQIPSADNLPLVETIEKLAYDFMKHTAIKIQLNIEGEAVDISERMKLTLMRFIQEGLTNAKRHGAATRVDIQILFEQAHLIIRMDDNGSGCSTLHEGFGLRSMKDRISELAGTVQYESSLNQGMRLTCCIPLAKDVSSA